MKKYLTDSGYRLVLDPGEYYAGQDQFIVSTLLGSCVAACIYDPVSRVAGMNHYILAKKPFANYAPIAEYEIGRYGDHAMELLIKSMLSQGANRKHLIAKVFGGGDVLHQHRGHEADSFSIGQTNVSFVHEYLESESIPIAAQDLGKSYGRIIHFNTRNYSVHMRKIIHNNLTTSIIKSEYI